MKKYLLLLSLILQAIMIGNAFVLPAGGAVSGGSASVTTPNATTTIINQLTDKMIVNWNSFGTGSNDLVKFVQPGHNSIAFVRVTGINASSLSGIVQSNGRVFLINPNGIVFGPAAKVDVAGLLATTFNIKDSGFMSGKAAVISSTPEDCRLKRVDGSDLHRS